MEKERKYSRIWKKYLPVISILLNKALLEEQQMILNEIDFKITGDRKASGYTFNLEIDMGKVINDISGTVVAVTLLEVLSADIKCRDILKNHKAKFSLNKNYLLKIKIFKR